MTYNVFSGTLNPTQSINLRIFKSNYTQKMHAVEKVQHDSVGWRQHEMNERERERERERESEPIEMNHIQDHCQRRSAGEPSSHDDRPLLCSIRL